jgi:hypothetical protein
MGGDHLPLIEDFTARAFAAVEEIGQICGVASQDPQLDRSRAAAQRTSADGNGQKRCEQGSGAPTDPTQLLPVNLDPHLLNGVRRC